MKDAEAQLIHDMRNTAMVLREAADQLNEQGESLPPATIAHLTAMLARRSDMLVQLLGDLTTSHLAGRGDLDLSLQRVSLPDTCREVIAERTPAAGVRIQLDVAEDALVVGDPIRITQVLDNLLTNALRYGGPEVRVSARRAGPRVSLTVSDDGHGVPTDLLDRLFDTYVHGEKSHGLGGSGMGLRISRQLCEAMSGTIQYDGSNGAAFTAWFPALPVASLAPGPDAAQAGHSVVFWDSQSDPVERLVDYVSRGLVAGEAAVVSATARHLELLDERLTALGIDPVAVVASGQYVRLGAERLHDDLPRLQHIDRDRFEALVGDVVRQVRRRWRAFRVYGEIVDLYCRSDQDHLALELESCWNGLLARAPFPLLCAYEIAPGRPATSICGCHDTVIPA